MNTAGPSSYWVNTGTVNVLVNVSQDDIIWADADTD